eukprot:gene7998-8857_t
MSLKQLATEIYNKGLLAVLPVNLARRTLQVKGNTLQINNTKYDLNRNVQIIGFGKAVLGMAKAVEDILNDHIKHGVISIPFNLQNSLLKSPFPEARNMLLSPGSRIEIREGAKNNLPDAAAEKNALEIEEVVQGLNKEDILLVLISGGGSALLPAPVKEITLSDKLKTIKALTSQGSNIQDLNTIRKKLSRLKGGKLAKLAQSEHIVSLILSDIVGDPIDLISSAPTFPDQSAYADCIEILNKYSIKDRVPKSVLEFLEVKSATEGQVHGKEDVENFHKVQNLIIGNNEIAVNECETVAKSYGFQPVTLSTKLDGDVDDVAKAYASLLCWMIHGVRPSNSGCFDERLLQEAWTIMQSQGKICIISAGETTVNVKGSGKGGRNQELALATAFYYDSLEKSMKLPGCSQAATSFCLLSVGTDGQDGPCTAAGAFFTDDLIIKANKEKIDIERFLANNGSNDFFTKFNNGENLMMTGLTGTNVMDLQILLIEKKNPSFSQASL